MYLPEMTMSEFAEVRRGATTAILPLGVVEQHGPHLPLGLDAMHALALAKETAKIQTCFVVPPLYYGICRSTSQHPGTVGIKSSTLQALIYDIACALKGQAISSLCLLTGHAGGTHQAALIDVGERLLAEPGLKMAVVCVLDLLAEAKEFLECPGDSHAGEVETSLALHLWPELVKGGAPEEYPTFPRFILVPDKVAHWPGGVWGDPSKASAEKGKRLIEVEARALAEVLRALEEQ